jgi:pimeloyl-ACP methyl ester carboxylesterase
MSTIVLAHGAWSAAWAWKKMRPLFAAGGHRFFAPTYTGLGERAHLARPEIDLATHIQDVVGVLEMEDLSDVTLIGHSYGGMVATGVAEAARPRIARIVYLDAFAPTDGQSLFDLLGPERSGSMRRQATEQGDGWRIPPIPMPPDTAPADVEWATPRRRWQPIRTFEQKISIAGKDPPPRHYIYATRSGPGDTFGQFRERAKSESGWRYHELDASHNPHITCPEALRDLLFDIVVTRGAA